MSQPLRVLLLEDVEHDVELVVRELRRAGYDPDWRRVDSEDAFLAQLEHQHDVILSDNSMPGFSAMEALHHLRHREIDLPFIIVSGSIGEEQAVSLLRHGAADYLMKDRPDRLGAAVTQALEQKRLRDDNRAAHRALQARTNDLLRSQEQLRALASDLTLTEQRERRKLATDLHDYLAQLLVVGRMKLRQAYTHAREPSTVNHLEQLDKIFDDSLTYTRTLIADLAPPSLQEFGLVEALHWLREQMRSHRLSVTVKTDLHHINLPEDQAILLFQSVRELLFNVIKHAQTDVALVKLDATRTGEFRVVVEDSGVGFDAAGLVARDPKTTRFGLFSVSERMQALGGRIELESSPSRGTRVSMILPYWPSDEKKSPVLVAQACVKSNGAGEVRSSMATAQSDRRSSQAERGRKNDQASGQSGSNAEVSFVRVMLVDDHTMVRKGIKSILDNHESITVIGEASDGQEAVSLAIQLRPDIVIMDVNLPILDGIAATAEITKQCPEVRVIGLSVHESSHWEKALMKAGAVGFVSKGSVTEELYTAIEQAMRMKTKDA
jgi:signal transduction histidine kinase